MIVGQRVRRFVHNGFTLPPGGVELAVPDGQQVGLFRPQSRLWRWAVSLEQRIIAVAYRRSGRGRHRQHRALTRPEGGRSN